MDLQKNIRHITKGDITMISQKQLSLADIFEDCKDIFESDKPQFLTLLENHIDLDEIIPDILENSVALPKFLMPLKSLVLSRIFYWTYNLFLISLLI